MFALSICNYEMRPLGGYLGVKSALQWWKMCRNILKVF